MSAESNSDYDSLFDGELDDAANVLGASDNSSAHRSCPDIPGLFFDPSIEIPIAFAEELWSQCMQTFFRDLDVNQVMLFERAGANSIVKDEDKSRSEDLDQYGAALLAEKSSSCGLPSFLTDLLRVLDDLLRDHLPLETHALLFPRPGDQTQARQVILNHYRPGEGITPHVDLLGRYGDGIIGVSLNSGCVMRFAKVRPIADAALLSVPDTIGSSDPTADHAHSNCDQSAGCEMVDRSGILKDAGRNSVALDAINSSCSQSRTENENVRRLYLPARSILVLCDDARYNWTHGIERLTEDLIETVDGAPPECLPRSERLSITFRWLLPGADVVGGVRE